MKIEKILETIHSISYEGLTEVIVPVDHLVKMKREIIILNEKVRQAQVAEKQAQAEAFKILANSEPIVQRFDNYA